MLITNVQGRTWNFSHAIGHLTIAGDGFLHPYSVATAESGVIYVLNRAPDPKDGDGNKRAQPNFKRIGKWKLDDEFIYQNNYGHLLNELYATRQISEGELQNLDIIIKGDVDGSIEALRDS